MWSGGSRTRMRRLEDREGLFGRIRLRSTRDDAELTGSREGEWLYCGGREG